MTTTEAPAARRHRYAAAIRQCIRDHTWPALTASRPPRFGATEYDLADTVLALVDLDVAAERAVVRDLLCTEKKRADDAIAREATADDAADELRADRDRIAAALEAVRAAVRIADDEDVTDWQRGYRACADRVTGALARAGADTAPDLTGFLAAIRDATAPGRATCDASIPGAFGQPIGPCILRHGHDGPVHKAASGAMWWPNDDPHATAVPED